ncbi:MAG: hypothetical protein AAGD25_22570 [Cyanobacteria bacterium P01_F01_bin.150]
MPSLNYDEIEELCEQLSYKDRLRLAQFLIQLALEEEEEENPTVVRTFNAHDSMTVDYVVERLMKLKPTRKKALLNSLASMFQHQGGINEKEQDDLLYELEKRRYLVIDGNGRVSYNFWDEP